MNDLISRDELLETIRSMTVTMGGRELFLPSLKDAVIDAISIAPAVSPTEWIEWYTDQIKQEFHYRIVKEDSAVDAVPREYLEECLRSNVHKRLKAEIALKKALRSNLCSKCRAELVAHNIHEEMDAWIR